MDKVDYFKMISWSVLRQSTLVFALVVLPVIPAALAGGSITNQGDTAVKVSGKSQNGISGSLSIKPGQTLQIRNPFLWIEHIPQSQKAERVDIKILEEDGTVGRITTSGERYVFGRSAASQLGTYDYGKKAPVKLTAGYATNDSNVVVSLNISKKKGRISRINNVLPGQTIGIPADTTDVTVTQVGSSFGDELINVIVVMPDGQRFQLRSTKSVAHIDTE